jgi:hypothetical protein
VMRALARDPAERYPTEAAIAEDLEEVLLSTKYQSKMLPNLLRELFGTGLQSLQIPVASELFDVTPEPASASPALAPVPPARVTPAAGAEAISLPSATPARWSWRRLSTAGLAMAATATLGVLLFGRGGGGRSNAQPIEHRPAAPVLPAVSAASKMPAVVVPSPLAPADVATPASDGPEAGVAASTSPPRPTRVSRARPRVDRDRIARGLSIDPFAEAAKRGGR